MQLPGPWHGPRLGQRHRWHRGCLQHHSWQGPLWSKNPLGYDWDSNEWLLCLAWNGIYCCDLCPCSCQLTDAVVHVADILHCAARSNLTMSEGTITRVLVELTKRLNSLVREFANAVRTSAVPLWIPTTQICLNIFFLRRTIKWLVILNTHKKVKPEMSDIQLQCLLYRSFFARLLIFWILLPVQNFTEVAADFREIFSGEESPSLTQEHLNDPEFIRMWFQVKLIPLLPNVPIELLSCLSTKNFSCPAYHTMSVPSSQKKLFSHKLQGVLCF